MVASPVLVTSHINGEKVFNVRIHAGLANVEAATITHRTQAGGGQRGTIGVFSRASRKRLLERLAMMRDCDTGYFCTLTYPGDFQYTWRECKSHLSALRKRILYYWPNARILWRMELKKRLSGASKGKVVPHYHLLVFGVPMGATARFRGWLRTAWDAIANCADKDAPMLRTQCDEIKSHKHAVYYASKYVAKVDDLDGVGHGRHWGTFGYFDYSESVMITITQRQLLTFKRYCRAYMKAKGKYRVSRMISAIREDFGFSVFGVGDNEPDSEGFPIAMRFALASCGY